MKKKQYFNGVVRCQIDCRGGGGLQVVESIFISKLNI